METKKQDYKKLLEYIQHNDSVAFIYVGYLEHKTFNKTFNKIRFSNEEYEVVVSTFNKIRFSNEEYEVVVSDDIYNEGFYYISIYEKKTETFKETEATKTMEEVLELIDANVFGVKPVNISI